MSRGRNIQEHLEPGDLGNVLDAPESDARRRHLIGCTRCQMLIEAYQEFLEEPNPDVAAEALKESLRVAIEARSNLSVESPAGEPIRVGRVAAGTPGFLASLRSGLARLLSQPIPAIAMLAMIVGAAIIFRELMPESREARLRQQTPSHVGGVAGHVDLASPVHQRDGSIELSWNPVSGADSYEIRIYSGTLDEVARLESLTTTRLHLNRADPALAHVPDTFLIKVLALHESDPIGESRPQTVSWR